MAKKRKIIDILLIVLITVILVYVLFCEKSFYNRTNAENVEAVNELMAEKVVYIVIRRNYSNLQQR